MKALELTDGRKILKFGVHENTWCELFLIEDDVIMRLAAHSLEEIVSKLLIAFAARGNRKYFLNEKKFFQYDDLFTVVNRNGMRLIVQNIEYCNEIIYVTGTTGVGSVK